VHRLTLVLVVALLAVGCSSGDDGSATATTATTGNAAAPTSIGRRCPVFAGPGEPVVGAVTVDGERRVYRVDVPPGYDGTEDVALVLNWHGNGSSAEQQAAYSGLADVADALVVTPEGTGDPRHFSLVPGPQNPDLRFARAIVEQVDEQFCLDPDLVFSTGISNGSGLTAELACQAPDVVAAVALVAATVGPLGCEASTRMPVLAFHGTDDVVVPYDGGPLGGTGLVLPSAQEGIRRWAGQNRCDPEPTVERIEPDVVHWTFEGCEADVEAYWVEGGGHVWPGAEERAHLGRTTSTIDASELISEWFEDHPREG
jgi:polyhydroxybutyrate depolymerase